MHKVGLTVEEPMDKKTFKIKFDGLSPVAGRLSQIFASLIHILFPATTIGLFPVKARLSTSSTGPSTNTTNYKYINNLIIKFLLGTIL